MENYFFDTEENIQRDKNVFVLIIYDIVENKKRVKFAKMLQGYGIRVQKSAFEALVPKSKYTKLLQEIPKYISSEDSVRVYKLVGTGQVTNFGEERMLESEDVIII